MRDIEMEYYFKRLDKSINLLCNLIDSAMYYKFKVRYDMKEGVFKEWKKQ